MNLTTARSIVRFWARNGGDSSAYADAQIDLAIQGICDDFILRTGCTKLLSQVAITSGSAVVPLGGITDSSGQPTFRPERLLSAYMTGIRQPLRLVTWEQLWHDQNGGSAGDLPYELAFADLATANIFPAPTADYTLYLRWREPITSWTAGTESGVGSIVFNLPDDWMRPILMHGAPAELQANEPEHKYTTVAWQRYTTFRDAMLDAGNLGAHVSMRGRAD
jgi:hypothetical protein